MVKVVKGKMVGVAMLPVFDIDDIEYFVNKRDGLVLATVRRDGCQLEAYKMFKDFILHLRLYPIKAKRLLVENGFDKNDAVKHAEELIQKTYEELLEQGAIEGRLTDWFEFVIEE